MRWPVLDRVNAEQAAVIERITKQWADQGKILEGGWEAFCAIVLPDASDLQKREMRKAYMLGAQHLWACIYGGVLDAGEEPTEADMRRMSLIADELEAFRRSLGN